ncbi:bifunctional metallophosphatase/5'-nucleotidase [Cellulomonas sp. ICMP 17802]|uniref:bifunctional metallophosphatase/5'-nucleotidase n=1 Tax=Cellulomonas sp. ICMP 17802 TaxID=3239199 RepID=UPI00351BD40A
MARWTMRFGTAIAAAGLVAASGLLAGPGMAGDRHDDHGHGSQRLKDIQLLAINDFHGNLQPPAGSSGTVTRLQPDGTTVAQTVGGVEYLATHLAQARQGHDRSLTIAAGDLIGASPLLSGAFHDEPTIEAMNALDLAVTSVGNHEFDEGSTELKRMQNGGCRTNPDGTPAADSCPGGPGSFTGADFPFLSANVVSTATGKTLFKPYVVKKLNGVKVGFIGMTLKGTPDIVTAAGVQGLTFLDEVTTANTYAKQLQRQGVQSIVVLLHQGGTPASGAYNYDCNAGGALGLTGAIVPIAQQISPAVDLIVTGHTHTAYTCNIPDPKGQPRMVTSGSSFGRLFTDIELKYDPRTNDIVRSSVVATNTPVTRDVAAAPAETEIISRYTGFLGPIASQVVGYIGGTIQGRGCTPTVCAASGETPAGDLIADAQLEGMNVDPLNPAGADFAIMNPGGIRGDFNCVPATSPCAQTYEQAFTVQPFTNIMNVVQMSGADVLTMFGQQWTTQNGSNKILQVSANVSEVIRATGATNENRLVSVSVDGVPVDPAATYRVAMNEFLGGGGDNFVAIRNGTKVFVGKSDLDVLIAYLGAHSSQAAPYPVPAGGRITLG